jgi:CheY-like chemotaxis protein
MNTLGRILIIDDTPDFLETYQDLLSAEGYVVETTKNRREALTNLDEPGWDVVLVDQKLQGPGGADTGLDLILEVRRRAPGAKVILVTAYATEEAVKRAFRDGAYDYLEKRGVFDALLRVKVRNSIEAVRERRLSAMSHDAAELALRETWASIKTEPDAHRKGFLLENLMALLFKTIPGFERLDTRVSNELEELDLLVENNGADAFWTRESPYILVECKNWSKRVGDKELRDLWGKMDGRYDRCRLAMLVAAGGFAETVHTLQLTKKEQGKHLVLLVGPGDLDELVQNPDRNAVLKSLHRNAVAGASNPPSH